MIKLFISTGTRNTPAQALYERIDYQAIGQVKLTGDVSLNQYEKCIV